MEVRYLPSALRALRRIDPVWRDRIVRKVAEYASDPVAHAGSVGRLVGDGRLRLRVGNYRVIFTEDGVVLMVEQLGHRSEVYRRLS